MAENLRPILAIGIDGVLNATGQGALPDGWHDTRACGYRIRYCPSHGPLLLTLALENDTELVWCSVWEERANEHIAPLAGLPQLPWVPLAAGRSGLGSGEYQSPAVTKAKALRVYAGSRPLCWLDSEADLAAPPLISHRAPHLIIQVDRQHGLQPHHIARAGAWLNGPWRRREVAGG